MSYYLHIQANRILSCYNYFEKGGKPAFVGEVRVYNGRKYQKQASNKWVELTESKRNDRSEFNKDDKFRIEQYTTANYMMLNEFLLGLTDTTDSEKYLIQSQVDELDRSLDKLPDFKGVVNRWASPWKDISEMIDEYQEGDLINFPAFTSTTKSNDIPSTFDPSTYTLKYKIKSKTGKDIEKYSEFGKTEREVLFKPNSVFQVKQVKQIKFKSGALKGKLFSLEITLEEV